MFQFKTMKRLASCPPGWLTRSPTLPERPSKISTAPRSTRSSRTASSWRTSTRTTPRRTRRRRLPAPADRRWRICATPWSRTTTARSLPGSWCSSTLTGEELFDALGLWEIELRACDGWEFGYRYCWRSIWRGSCSTLNFLTQSVVINAWGSIV